MTAGRASAGVLVSSFGEDISTEMFFVKTMTIIEDIGDKRTDLRRKRSWRLIRCSEIVMRALRGWHRSLVSRFGLGGNILVGHMKFISPKDSWILRDYTVIRRLGSLKRVSIPFSIANKGYY